MFAVLQHAFTVLSEYDEEAARKFKCSLTKTKETSKKFHTTLIDGEMVNKCAPSIIVKIPTAISDKRKSFLLL